MPLTWAEILGEPVAFQTQRRPECHTASHIYGSHFQRLWNKTILFHPIVQQFRGASGEGKS